jgi:hypothetical protein
MVMMFESLVSGLYEFVCRITRNDSLPTVNAEMTLYALEFVVLFGVLFYVFGVGALCFWLSLAIVLVFNEKRPSWIAWAIRSLFGTRRTRKKF